MNTTPLRLGTVQDFDSKPVRRYCVKMFEEKYLLLAGAPCAVLLAQTCLTIPGSAASVLKIFEVTRAASTPCCSSQHSSRSRD